MWLASRSARRRSCRTSGTPRAAPAALREWDGTFVQAATPFLADLVRVVEEGEEPRRRRCGSSSSPAPRCRGRWPSARPRVLGAAVCGAWGSTESCLGALAAPGDDPAKVWGTDGRALPGTRIRIVDEAGNVLPPGERGQLRGDQPLPLRGLPRPSRPDRGGDDRRRLVPDRRPGDDRRRRLPADHRPGQGRRQPRRREGAGRRDRAAAARAPGGRARWRSWRCPTSGSASAPAPSSSAPTATATVDLAAVREFLDAARGLQALLARAGRVRSRRCPAPPVARSRSSSCASAPASCGRSRTRP